jgi:hypothetical protein
MHFYETSHPDTNFITYVETSLFEKARPLRFLKNSVPKLDLS